MMTVSVLVIVTLGLMVIVKYAISPKYGDDVRSRFLEHLNYIPSQKPGLLNRDNLATWLADGRNANAISGYVFPVLFPFDILFLISVALLLGFASVALAGSLGFLANVPVWIWWLFPLCYAASDLIEDTTIAAILKFLIPLTEVSFKVLSTLTAIKLATIGIAIGQIVFLGALYVLLFFFPANPPA